MYNQEASGIVSEIFDLYRWVLSTAVGLLAQSGTPRIQDAFAAWVSSLSKPDHRYSSEFWIAVIDMLTI